MVLELPESAHNIRFYAKSRSSCSAVGHLVDGEAADRVTQRIHGPFSLCVWYFHSQVSSAPRKCSTDFGVGCSIAAQG